MYGLRDADAPNGEMIIHSWMHNVYSSSISHSSPRSSSLWAMTHCSSPRRQSFNRVVRFGIALLAVHSVALLIRVYSNRNDFDLCERYSIITIVAAFVCAVFVLWLWWQDFKLWQNSLNILCMIAGAPRRSRKIYWSPLRSICLVHICVMCIALQMCMHHFAGEKAP